MKAGNVVYRCLVLFGLSYTPVFHAQDLASTPSGASSPLLLKTSDAAIQQAFDWAKTQALAYVEPRGDPVGDWYEAALPGRHAFCMRDVSHQTMGAYALGLAPQNRNMLRHFAESISDSKD